MTNDVTFLAAIAGVAAVWSQIRGFLDRVRSLFITQVKLNGEIAELMTCYIYEHGRVINWGDRFICSGSTWVRPLDRVTEVVYERAPSQPLIVWLHGSLLMFHCPSQSYNGIESNLPESVQILVLTALRGCLDVKAITRSALDSAYKRQSTGRRYFVRRVSGKRSRGNGTEESYGSKDPLPPSSGEGIKQGMRFLHWQSEDIGAPQPKKPFDAMALCIEGAAARKDFTRWLTLKKWYKERDIPWRRGHLYYGPPGTGKTSLARALAQEADMPVFAYDLSTLDNEQFSEAWQNMQEHTPCMALIEDIDGTFQGRSNVRSGEHVDVLTFDCLLNAIGGIQTCDGVFIVVTTNKPDTLDDALGKPQNGNNRTTRPGRIDAGYCLEMPSDSQRIRILQRIMGAENVEKPHIEDTDHMTAAQVTEYAITKALEKTWG